MNHLFVPYKIATGLKEIEFSEDCFAYYQIDEAERAGDPVLCYLPRGKDLKGQNVSEDVRYQKYLKDQHLCVTTSFWWKHKFVAVAPTWNQAFDWFREKHNLPSYIRTIWQAEWQAFSYQWHIVENAEDYNCVEHFKSYEQAELACIQKLIEIVKQ